VRNVKGTLFADYVRMIRRHKEVDWSRHLEPGDLAFLEAKVDPSGWYPMTTFERLGDAILHEVAKGELDAVRLWGRLSCDALRFEFPTLVADGDPVDTLRRFRVIRSTFFDFEALEVPALHDDHASIVIHYHMGATAEEAASYQTMGFFERILEIAGSTSVDARFLERSWAGDRTTLLSLDWRTAASD